jgi:F-type H+-transporting ATPase subunit delta
MVVESKIAVRYANALIGLAKERNEVEKILSEMQDFSTVYNSNPDFKYVLKNPVIRQDAKLKAIESIFQGLSVLSKSFIEKMVRAKREAYLGEIAHAYITLYNAMKGIVVADVVSAFTINDEIRNEVKNLIKKQLHGTAVTKIILNERVDTNLIGGFIITVNGVQIDTSFSNKIVELKRSFKQNLYVKEY